MRLPRSLPVFRARLTAAGLAWSGLAGFDDSTGAAWGQTGDLRVHDPVLERAGGVYWIFATGTGVAVKRSTDLFRWTNAGRALPDNLPPWAAERVPGSDRPWAPEVVEFGGRWHLYYSVSTFGKNTSAIGHATSMGPAADGQSWSAWIDHGVVVTSTPESDFNAIDPAVVLDHDGRPWLAWGSFWGGLKLAALDPATGALAAGPEGEGAAATGFLPLARRPGNTAIEAPALVRRGEWFYLFASVDFCCRGAASDYQTIVGRARDVRGPYADRDGRALLEGGGTVLLAGQGDVRGPGHNDVLLEAEGTPAERAWLVHHYYDAADAGRSKLHVRPLTWDAAGWPVPGEPLAAPPPVPE